ncbi:nitrophenyl compound nitroreductase subunit ArsF family protein [Rhodoflexus caldus]|uniref:nitrophenyl compound nitroreductase subunit ArsF family protein n=1 Tax=Rhodoflexus caldus TaxID=2891236 RepID=UPI00202A5446|nr:nitrophenyl compound nitroreductase subunit ArsF family protein [Rhodoflexus caldus]
MFSFTLLIALLVANTVFAQTVEVIDFHSTHRCKTCLAIEKSAKAVLEKEFANELKSGKIIFKTINVDEASNAKIAEQFEATGSALWIYRADKKIKMDLTDFAFMNVGNAEKFSEKIKTEVQKALK